MLQPTSGVTRETERRWLHVPLSRVWAVVAIVLPVILVTAARIGTVDLTYHLRAGAMMLDSGALLRVDSFTFTAAQAPWVDQQWLTQVLLALVFRAGGWFALALTRSLLAAASLALVYAACRASGASARRSAWLTLGSACLMLPTLQQLRPQLFGIACFALTLWLIAARLRHPRRLWLVPPLVMLWVNLHGTFFLAIGIVGLAWLADVHARERNANRLVAVGLASIAATMLNPFGARVWSYVFELSTNAAVRGLVAEWQPTSADSFSGAAFLVSVPVVIWLLMRARTEIAWPTVLTLLSFFVIGLLSVRGVYWWAMAIPVLLAGHGREPTIRNGADDPAGPANVVNVLIIGVTAAALLLQFGRWLPYRATEPPSGSLLAQAPPGITRALRGVLGPGERVFNAQAWGSWFEFALPGHPVAVDSRIEFIPAPVWKRYADVSNGREGWQRILSEWNIRVVAVHRTQQPELLARISRDAGWSSAYHDDDGAVFIRRDPAPSAVVR